MVGERGVPSGSRPTTPPLTGSRRNGLAQPGRRLFDTRGRWARVASQIGKEKQVWRKKLRTNAPGGSAPVLHPTCPKPHVRNAVKNEKIRSLFPEFSQKNFTKKFESHNLKAKIEEADPYIKVPDPGPLKFEAPGVHKGPDRIPIADKLGLGPIPDVALDVNSSRVEVDSSRERFLAVFGDSDEKDEPEDPLKAVVETATDGCFVEVEDACTTYFNDAGVCKYRCEFREYTVPIAQFHGFWKRHLSGNPNYNSWTGKFFAGSSVKVQLPVALVGNISQYWAHTEHDDKLESFLVSVSKTKHSMREIHFPTPESAVTSALYVPVYCYITYWAEQQSINSIIRDQALPRSRVWVVADICGSVCFAVAAAHIFVPAMILAGVGCVAVGVGGKLYDCMGGTYNDRFNASLERHDY